MRIVGGDLRGRRLGVPTDAGFRPTGDRVRESLFNLLGGWLEEAPRVADLFAGSGALGLEALSRGADQVTFVERHRPTARRIQALLAEWELSERGRVRTGDALAFIRAWDGAPFGLILADPPYGDGQAEALVEAVDARVAALLVPGGKLVVERSTRASWTPGETPGLTPVRTAAYGAATLEIYRRPEV